MSINKALNQVMMYEEIGGKKKENPQPTDTTPVKMPEAPRPAGSPPQRITGVNAPSAGEIDQGRLRYLVPDREPQPRTRRPEPPPPPRPVPDNGGAEVTPPEGLPESMKAFWKQRLVNQLNEKKGLGSVAGKVAGKVLAPLGVAFDLYDLYDIYKNPQNYPAPKSPQGPPAQSPTSPPPQIAPKY